MSMLNDQCNVWLCIMSGTSNTSRIGSWRHMIGIVCDKMLPILLKVIVYKSVARLIRMCWRQTWTTRNVEQDIREIGDCHGRRE